MPCLVYLNAVREEAEQTARHEVGVIVSDHEMRGLNGISLLAQIKRTHP